MGCKWAPEPPCLCNTDIIAAKVTGFIGTWAPPLISPGPLPKYFKESPGPPLARPVRVGRRESLEHVRSHCFAAIC